mmetsp:Transcript_70098/g.182700  ORF Transcript_70098/g.182700 Transcript_70098/m.182700 type:complete len:393 (+) Transcript_70098:131-1309(+)
MSVKRHDKLKYVKFGKTDMMVSEICGGTMTWGSFNADESQCHAQMDALVSAGVNFFDTAELYPVAFNYGKTTETWMGNWLQKHSGKRSELYFATKCNAAGIGGHGEFHDYNADVLLASCKASIERLRCEYIDLYYLHFPVRDMPIFGCASFFPDGKNRPFKFMNKGELTDFDASVLAVKKLFDAGLIKHWGLSNENAYGVTMFCLTCDKHNVPRPVCVQNDYSLLNRTYESDTYEACHRFGLVGIPYGVLCGGVLTGKYFDKSEFATKDPDRPLAECRHRSRSDFQPRYGMPAAMKATEKYMALAKKYGLTPAELAIAFALRQPCNTCVISGTTTVRQVEEWVGASKIESLPEELLLEIDGVHEECRNPSMYYVNKDACMKAEGRSASTPEE